MTTRLDRIEVNPDILFGKPVIRGTRLSVEHILRKLGAGMNAEDIIAEYPKLTHADIRAAEHSPLTTFWARKSR